MIDLHSLLPHSPALLLLLALPFLRLCVAYARWRSSPLRELPGPRGSSFLFGEFLAIFKEPFFAPQARWWRESGHAPLFSYPSLFGSWVVVPTDPEIIKGIMTAPSAQEPVRYPKNFAFFRDVVGDGMVALEGKMWSRHRRIVQPCFQTGLVKEALAAAVPAKVKSLMESWKKSEGRVIDIYAHMSAVTLDILGEVSLAHDFRSLETLSKWAVNGDSDEIDEIQDPMMQSLRKIFKPTAFSIIVGVLKIGWILSYIMPLRKDAKKLLDEAAEDILVSARDNPPPSESAKSLIHVLLGAMRKDESGRNSLTLQEMKDEIKLFIIAGHETTSTLCYWAFYALGKHPEVQRRVAEDILRCAPDGTPIDLDAVAEMAYFTAFLQETLRLYSPAGLLIRFPSRNEEWNGTVIPAKTRIDIPIFLLHRHPGHWKDPERFLPERWLPGSDADNSKVRHPFCFLPFSAGGRNCIGEKFARFEAQLILANLIRAFEIQLAPSMRDAGLEFRASLTIKSKPKVQIVVKSR